MKRAAPLPRRSFFRRTPRCRFSCLPLIAPSGIVRGRCSARRETLILGIETSCDDTGVAVVSDERGIVAQSLSSQFDVHKDFKGVVPHLAKREHEQNLEPLLRKTMREAFARDHDEPYGSDQLSTYYKRLSAVAVTAGPGLAMCLSVGLERAKQIAQTYGLPFIAVNHLEAHALVPRLSEKNLDFPFLVCLISGGHTQLLVCRDVNDYLLLGGTLDDALGEAFDKAARLIQPETLDEHGGEIIERLARTGNADAYSLPVPMKGQQNCNFSFSGLKSAMVRLVALKGGVRDERDKSDLAASFQRAIVAHMQDRIRRAIDWMHRSYATPVSSLVVAGGVARNKALREMFERTATEHNMRAIFPPPSLCTDNGVMVAWAGVERHTRGLHDDPNAARFHPRWPLDRNATTMKTNFSSNLREGQTHKALKFDA